MPQDPELGKGEVSMAGGAVFSQVQSILYGCGTIIGMAVVTAAFGTRISRSELLQSPHDMGHNSLIASVSF